MGCCNLRNKSYYKFFVKVLLFACSVYCIQLVTPVLRSETIRVKNQSPLKSYLFSLSELNLRKMCMFYLITTSFMFWKLSNITELAWFSSQIKSVV